MSLNKTRTIPVFEKTSEKQQISFTPNQPTTESKIFPVDYKKVNPMLIG